MKRLLAGLALVVAAATLSGCYYDPGYGYVRSSGYSGDAYYGHAAPVYDGGYYAAPGYYDGGYYGGYGCCYASGVIYGGSRYYRGGYRGYGGGYRGHDHDYRGHDGHWQGHGNTNGHTGGHTHSGGHSGHGDDGHHH